MFLFRPTLLIATLFVLLSPLPVWTQQTITFSTHAKKDSIPFARSEEIYTEAFRRLGKQFILEAYPAKRALDMANTGVTDGEALRIEGLEKQYENLIRVPVVVRSAVNYAFSNKDLHFPNGWEDLKGLRVAIIRGSVRVTKMAEKYSGKVVFANSQIQQLRLLTSKRVDVVVESPVFITPLLRLDEFKNTDIHIIPPALSTINLSPYLNKDNEPLVGPLTQALEDMKADGTFDRIITKYQQLTP